MPKDMISKALNDELNNQIFEELQSAYIYMGMSIWAEEQGLHKFAKFMKIHAETEEYRHAMKFMAFIQEAGGSVKLAALNAIDMSGYTDVKTVLNIAIKHEQHISARIRLLSDVAKQNNDLYAKKIINYFNEEQMEEENLFEELMNLYEQCDGRVGLWNSMVKHPK